MTAYAVLADVYNLGVPQAAVASVATLTQQAALDAANAEVDGYLAGRFKLPLSVWGADLKMHVCARAAFTILTVRGYNPEDGADKAIEDRSKAAEKWLKGIADGDITPNVTDSSTVGSNDSGTPFAYQMTVSQGPSPNPSQLSLGSGPPSITETAAGFVTVGSPKVRGW